MGFHQRDDVGAFSKKRRNARKDVAERDERDVNRDDIDERRQVRGLERSCVGALDDDHARIVTQAPVELAVANVERDHADRAAFQEDVGESSRGRADVERLAAFDEDAERVECMRQLDAATTDIRMVRLLQGHLGIVGDLLTRFLGRLAVDEHDAREHQRGSHARATARGRG